MNGSGKTTLAQKLLSAREYVIVIDTKGELNWPGFTITKNLDAAFQEKWAIYRPRSSKGAPVDLGSIERLFHRAYAEGGWTIYVDEIYMLGVGSVQRFPPSFITCLTAGRSNYVSVFVSTQRPRFLPLFAMTEPKHIFAFELGSSFDRQYLMKMVGVDGLDTKVSGHDFLYYNRDAKKLTRSKLQLN